MQLLLSPCTGQRTVDCGITEGGLNEHYESRHPSTPLKEQRAQATKAEAMSPTKRLRAPCHGPEIMAPLKHDCLFPLMTPTCQWVGHATPETAPRLQQRSRLYATFPLGNVARELPARPSQRACNATPNARLQPRLECSYAIPLIRLEIKGTNRGETDCFARHCPRGDRI